MDERERQLIETYRAEALALFQANQAGRRAAERVGALLLTLIGVAVATGVNAHSDAVAIALPPLVLLLLSYMFQQYADVTVTGAARRALEKLLVKELGAHALIYEYAVAGVRQKRPLVTSVRLLQTMTGLVLLAVVGVGFFVALKGHPWYIEAGFAAGTAVGFLSAVLSYRDMLRSGRIATREIEQALGLPWQEFGEPRESPRRTLDATGVDREDGTVFISCAGGCGARASHRRASRALGCLRLAGSADN